MYRWSQPWNWLSWYKRPWYPVEDVDGDTCCFISKLFQSCIIATRNDSWNAGISHVMRCDETASHAWQFDKQALHSTRISVAGDTNRLLRIHQFISSRWRPIIFVMPTPTGTAHNFGLHGIFQHPRLQHYNQTSHETSQKHKLAAYRAGARVKRARVVGNLIYIPRYWRWNVR